MAASRLERRKAQMTVLVCTLLILVAWIVFGETVKYDFVNYDDDAYVYNNLSVKRGLTVRGIATSLTESDLSLWTPLTKLSHMLDVQLFGLKPAGHHASNVILHSATAILLFIALRGMTGALWSSALVAALFAIHPLRVESVAWVSERKDVLSGFFFMLSLCAYDRYTRHGQSTLRYLEVVFFFVLGLLSKPIVLTLPFVLLLLDYWPLRRTDIGGQSSRDREQRVRVRIWPKLLIEKIPLLALSAISGCLALLDPFQWNGLRGDSTIQHPLFLRIGNAVVSYVAYLWQMIYPFGLAVRYPFPANGVPLWEIAASLILLLSVSSLAYIIRRNHPYVLVGWLWYLGMLVPVIGVIELGGEARADRYTYLSQIGLYLLLIWAIAAFVRKWQAWRGISAIAAFLVLAGLAWRARVQTSHWRNSEALWINTLAATANNCVAHNNLGFVLLERGEVDDAISQFERALEIDPNYVVAQNDLGYALLKKGQRDEAIFHLRQALKIRFNYAGAHNNLGLALVGEKRVEEGIAEFVKAIEIKRDFAEPHNNLGNALQQSGKVSEAIAHFKTAIAINPDLAEAYNNLGNALLQRGEVSNAIYQYQKALAIKPDYVEAHNNLGGAFLQKGDLDEAIVHCRKALEIQPNYSDLKGTLGKALMQKGEVDEAILYYNNRRDPDEAGARFNLALALSRKGRVSEAISQFEIGLVINPRDEKAHTMLGLSLFQSGRLREAIQEYQKATKLTPDYAEAHRRLGEALAAVGDYSQAIDEYRIGLRLPDENNLEGMVASLNNLAWLRATAPQDSIRNGVEAVDLARRCCELMPSPQANQLDTLAAAYAESGDFQQAIECAVRAIQLAKAIDDNDLCANIEKRLDRYRRRMPYRQDAK